jgi:hypothetical protein
MKPGIAFFVLAAVLASCRGQPNSTMSLEELFKTRGAPALMASDFDVTKPPGKLVEARFYAVTKDVRNASPKDIPPNCTLVISSDKRFNQHVKYHFADLSNPEDYTGSTMFSSVDDEGTTIEIVSVDANRRVKVSFVGKVHIAFIEVGAKGHLIRQPPKRLTKEAKK